MNKNDPMYHFDKAMKKADHLFWFLGFSMIAPPVILILVHFIKQGVC